MESEVPLTDPASSAGDVGAEKRSGQDFSPSTVDKQQQPHQQQQREDISQAAASGACGTSAVSNACTAESKLQGQGGEEDAKDTALQGGETSACVAAAAAASPGAAANTAVEEDAAPSATISSATEAVHDTAACANVSQQASHQVMNNNYAAVVATEQGHPRQEEKEEAQESVVEELITPERVRELVEVSCTTGENFRELIRFLGRTLSDPECVSASFALAAPRTTTPSCGKLFGICTLFVVDPHTLYTVRATSPWIFVQTTGKRIPGACI